MKNLKDWLPWVLAVVPGTLGYGFLTLFQGQNFWPLFVAILLIYVATVRLVDRFQKLQKRLRELEDRLSQVNQTHV